MRPFVLMLAIGALVALGAGLRDHTTTATSAGRCGEETASPIRSGFVRVPEVRRLRLDEAFERLAEVGLATTTSSRLWFGYGIGLGSALEQSPKPGTVVRRGTPVQLSELHSGPHGLLPGVTRGVVVPDVTGFHLEKALDVLDAADAATPDPIMWQTTLPPLRSPSRARTFLASYCVVSQKPPAGTEVVQTKLDFTNGRTMVGTAPALILNVAAQR